MQLDRGFIERDDFPRTRKGYDPQQVQQHLKEIADHVERLQTGSLGAPAVADSAAEQVRAILEAAERTGAELETKAREEAERIRADAEGLRAEADSEAASARQRAAGEAAERLELVHEASARVVEGAAAIERALARLHEKVGDLGAALELDAEGAGPATDAVLEEEGALAAEPAVADETGDGAHEREADVQDVRLIALNMALNGSPREETAKYLEENFGLEDPDALLDEVYARAGG